MYLRCLAGDRPRSWLQWLPWAEFCYNTSLQSANKSTPFRVVYGRDPPALTPYQPGSARVPAVDAQLRDRDEFLAEIKERLVQAQQVMKETSDKDRREFSVGDWVWLCLQKRAATSTTQASLSKLGPRYFGPYQVVQRVGAMAYRLMLPPKVKIHDVFHVSLLKKFEGAVAQAVVPLPDILHGWVLPTPALVTRARLNRGRWELLVK